MYGKSIADLARQLEISYQGAYKKTKVGTILQIEEGGTYTKGDLMDYFISLYLGLEVDREKEIVLQKGFYTIEELLGAIKRQK